MKLFNVFLALGLLFICGCERAEEMTRDALVETATPLRVTMVYPDDCVVDAATYCDAFQIGVRSAEAELGILLTEVYGIENDLIASEALLRDAAETSDLVLTAGYQMGTPLANVAPDYPDVQFAIFDVVLDIPNVASINYKANEGSFLVGAVAGLKTESNKIGYIGGADVPLLQAFEAGYVAGIEQVNPDAAVIVEYIAPDASGFGQPDKAKALALAQYARGVDVIYVAAGKSGQGVLEAAIEQNKLIIWVDQNGNHLAPVVLTSMVKEIPLSVKRVIGEAVSGNFVGGERYFGLKAGAVSYAVDADNRDLLSDDLIASVEMLKAAIIAGEVVVPNTVAR